MPKISPIKYELARRDLMVADMVFLYLERENRDGSLMDATTYITAKSGSM